MCGTSCCPSSTQPFSMVSPCSRQMAAAHQTCGRPELGACTSPLLLVLPDWVETRVQARHSHVTALSCMCCTLSFSEVSSWKGAGCWRQQVLQMLDVNPPNAPDACWPCPGALGLPYLKGRRCLPGHDARPGQAWSPMSTV